MTTQALLHELDLHPRKRLGQSFLVDWHVLGRILAAADVGPQDTVLEIGAGLGILTEALGQRARRVVAVEIDQRLVSVLHERLKAASNTEIILGDILALDIPGLLPQRCWDLQQGSEPRSDQRYKVVANIPYYITSAVLRRILEQRLRPEIIVLMVQKEVARRITAGPGEMSLLAVSVQFYGLPRVVAPVPARCFYPVPKVDSAIVRIDPHPRLPLNEEDIAAFFDVVRAGFGQRRKQLHNALLHGLHLPAECLAESLSQAGIDGRRRAETLSVKEWVTLYGALKSRGS
jgi:16S rRNA (adenine1518-N6/adenine1519-N6)-dimethyltransferase